MVAVELVNDKPVTSILRSEGAGVLRALLHHVDSAELLAPARLREEVVSEDLETQKNTPHAYRQLRQCDSELTQDVVDEGGQEKLHPLCQDLRMNEHSAVLRRHRDVRL